MLKKFLFFLPYSIFSAGTFTIGIAEYSTSWQITSGQLSGSNQNLELIMPNSQGPNAVFTYTYNQFDYNNPPSTLNALASVQFLSTGVSYSLLYGTNNTLSNFLQTPLSSYIALSFLETNSKNYTQALNLFMNTNSGNFSPSACVIFPYQNQTYSALQAAALPGSNLIYNGLSSSQFINNKGNLSSFSQSIYSPASFFSVISTISTASSSSVATTAYVQNNYGISSIDFFKQTTTSNGLSHRLSDQAELSVNFLNFDQVGSSLFFGDNSTYGTRLGACKYLSNGNFSSPIYLFSSYSYTPSFGILIDHDSLNNTYLTWNGSSNIYTGIYNTTSSTWQPLVSPPAALFSSSTLPGITPFVSGLFLTQITNSNDQFTISYNILNNTTFTYGTTSNINQTTSGSITYFQAEPSCQSITDTNGNIVSVFSGQTATSNQIFYNVYSLVTRTFFGITAINTDAPSAISPPVLITSGANLGAIWSENINGSYTIFASIYTPSTTTFSLPVEIATNFSSQPQILALPDAFGFIYMGSN